MILLCVQLLLDLMVFREQALRLILDLSSTVITLLVSLNIVARISKVAFTNNII